MIPHHIAVIADRLKLIAGISDEEATRLAYRIEAALADEGYRIEEAP